LITVSVRDSAGQPLEHVSLVLLDARDRYFASTQTGANGLARMPRADTGTFSVFARRVGFQPERSPAFEVSGKDSVGIRITLNRLALVLDPIVVSAQRDSVRRSTAFGFNLRATGGYIITPAEIEASIMGARDVADVLGRRALPGMVIDRTSRCPRSIRGPGCLPFVIDGQVFPNGNALQDVIVPEMIDYIVVLRGSEVGVRYGSIGHNGIILIATRRDWKRRPP
jgi:hypothetical protein